MKTRNQSFALATLLAAFATGAIAEYDAVTLLTYPDSSISVGLGHVSGEREQFGVFDDLRDNDTLLLLDADINERHDETGTWVNIKARNLGIDNRSIEMGYECQGNWGIGVEYDEITYSAPYTVNTAITGLGTERQIVPFGSPPALAAHVPGTGKNVVLNTEREKTGINAYKYLTPNLRFKIDFKNEDKDGDRHWGRGDEPEFAAEPINSTTRQLDVALDYVARKFQLRGGYYGSQYRNDNSLVFTWGDDMTPARIAYLSLPLDNQAHQFFLNGGYNFTSATRGTFRLSYTHATQDEHLPTSDLTAANANPAYFPQNPKAPTSLDGELNTTLLFLGLTSRPLKNLSLAANLRYHKVDEKTPEWEVISSPTHSTPLDYKTISGKLEGIYRLLRGYSLIAGIDIKNQDRTVPFGNLDAAGFDDERFVPFRSELDETTYRAQLRKSMSETVNGSLAISHSKRDGSRYSDAIHSFDPTGVNPEPPAAIDPLNISDRKRNKLRATIDWSPTDRANLQFNYEIAKDDYSGQTYGLRDGKAQLVSVDSGYTLNEDWQVTGWVSHDRNRAEQHNWRDANPGSGANFSEANLFDTLTDTGTSVGIELEGKVNPKLKLGVGIEWTRTRSEYDQDIVQIGAGPLYYPDTAPLPDIESTASKLDLFAEYAMAKNTDLRFDIIHERWKTNDWTWEFSDGTSFIYTGRNDSDGTVVIQDPKQSSTFVGVRYIYKFM